VDPNITVADMRRLGWEVEEGWWRRRRWFAWEEEQVDLEHDHVRDT